MIQKRFPDVASLFEADETAWLESMAELICQHRYDELDYPNLSEYLLDMGRRDRREVKSRLTVLMAHLLKWSHEPERRSGSWQSTIIAQRQKLRDLCSQGVLRGHAQDVLAEAYRDAVERAAAETGLSQDVLPAECPYSLPQLFSSDMLVHCCPANDPAGGSKLGINKRLRRQMLVHDLKRRGDWSLCGVAFSLPRRSCARRSVRFHPVAGFSSAPRVQRLRRQVWSARRPRGFSCRDQFLCLAFAQLTYRESLRDIETCLRALGPKLYHAGFRGQVSRSTLADANRTHDWRIFADFAQVLIRRARQLYASDALSVQLEQTVYALDSTTIDLCLSLFPWAPFRRRKAAVKLHTLIDLRGNIPCFIYVSHGKMHDVKALDHLPIEAGAFYVMDRGYVDFVRLHRFTQGSAFFVTRCKKNLDCTRRARREVDKTTGLRSDQTVVLAGPKSSRRYPDPLRRVAFYDTENQRRLVFLTNNFTLPALTIARLYKCRWQVELFFKWIKQHLRIKAFYGNTENAVKTQVWIAISVYVLVAIVKKELQLKRSLYEILQILSVTLFEKTPIFEALCSLPTPNSEPPFPNQLTLFDL